MKAKHITPQDQQQITRSGSLTNQQTDEEDLGPRTEDQFIVGKSPMARHFFCSAKNLN